METKNNKTVYIILGIVIAAVIIGLIIFGKGKKYDANLGDNGARGSLVGYDREDLTIQQALVNDVSVAILESFPVQVRVTAKGDLRNGCEEIYEIVQQKDGQAFNITMNAAAPKDAVCTQVIRPFEETFALDVMGLSAGTYTVNVNGITDTFILTADNTLDYDSSSNK